MLENSADNNNFSSVCLSSRVLVPLPLLPKNYGGLEFYRENILESDKFDSKILLLDCHNVLSYASNFFLELVLLARDDSMRKIEFLTIGEEFITDVLPQLQSHDKLKNCLIEVKENIYPSSGARVKNCILSNLQK